jgi:hypothetical protein
VTTEHKAVAEKKGASRVASYLVLFWLTFAWLVVIVGLALISSETVSDTLPCWRFPSLAVAGLPYKHRLLWSTSLAVARIEAGGPHTFLCALFLVPARR